MSFQKRKADGSLENPSKRRTVGPGAAEESLNEPEEYWMVQWRNPQTKKHKTWDGDGILVACSGKGTLYDEERKIIASGKLDGPLTQGRVFSWATKDFELDRQLSRNEYISGNPFGGSSTVAVTHSSINRPSKAFKAPTIRASVSNPRTSVEATVEPVPLNNVTSTVNTPIFLAPQNWTANWRKPQTKKHRTWDGDAYISLREEKLFMISEDGELMGSVKWKGDDLYSGYTTMINGKTVELDARVSASQVPKIRSRGQDPDESNDLNFYSGAEHQTSPASPLQSPLPSVLQRSTNRFVAPASFYGTYSPVKKFRGPLHDPNAEGAIVMKTPTKDHMALHNKKNYPVVAVVLDPVLSRKMRPHQIDGVKFMYEAVMGLRRHEGQGCILADEMGLGKTLQTVGLVWTLLKQNPYAAPLPTIQKVLIVTPVSLLNNWKAEFQKWLGKDRLGIVVCDKDKKAALMFMNAKNQQVLIIGYERLRTVVDDLVAMVPPIGLIICDEGHRLKSANNKAVQTLTKLKTPRRIILSGTPIQNDLGEFHTMADFCNPGLLDTYTTFRKAYEMPILQSRAPDATVKEIELGKSRIAQLLTVSKSFVLRREATILKNQLPPKHEYVVFVKPTTLQLEIFSRILQPTQVDDLIQGSTAESLAVVNTLTKISNSPILLKATADKARSDSDKNLLHSSTRAAVSLLPEHTRITDFSLSGKLIVLAKLLEAIFKTTDEKCVLVSHYTSTINILEAFCREKHYSYHRLDGQTPANKRQELVTTFNKSSRKQSFVFLLSSKAGGVGLNLIGASRLCLVDSDWNPTHDLQSMARCYRDGQKRPVYIYRLLTAGTIDEKIYQRQVTKLSLSDSLIGSSSTGSKVDSFSRKDLRDIFRIHSDTPCNTHDLLECPCEDRNAAISVTDDLAGPDEDEEPQRGFMKAVDLDMETIEKTDRAYQNRKKADLAILGEWTHYSCVQGFSINILKDNLLRGIVDEAFARVAGGKAGYCPTDHQLAMQDLPGGFITFLFERSSVFDRLDEALGLCKDDATTET